MAPAADSAKVAWRQQIQSSPEIRKANKLLGVRDTLLKSLSHKTQKMAQRILDTTRTKEELDQLVRKEKGIADKLLDNAVGTAVSQQELFDSKHQHGVGKVEAGLQSVITSFSSFLESYSGIVELMKDVNPQFGGIAYSILSVFLIVVVNKSTEEERIRDSLEAFSRSLPRLSKIQDYAPTEAITNLLVRVYFNVLEFAKRATIYYERSGFGRLFYVTIHPPRMHLDPVRDSIVHDSQEIHDEMFVVVARASLKTEQMTREILSAQDEERMLRNQTAVLDLKPDLGDVEVRPDERLQYLAALEDPAGISEHYTRLDFGLFLKRREYISWVEADSSGLLLLKGRTLNDRSGFSWLSPAALRFLSFAENDKNFCTTHCLAETSAWSNPDSQPSAHLVISKIIWQLLNKKPDLVQDPRRLRDIRDRIKHNNWNQPCPKSLIDLLIELLSEFPRTYIILDRIDRCDCYSVNFLDELLRIIRECRTVLKIFVVLCETSANDFKDTALNKEGVKGKYHIITMDQRVEEWTDGG